MTFFLPFKQRRVAFTLIELLTSMTVLTLLVLMVAQMVGSTTRVTTGDRKHLDADGQARLVFDRMGTDLARILHRADVDFVFSRPAGNGQGVSDRMFFFSEAPAFYDGDTTTLQSRSSVALLGYRINANYQLERLGKLLTWDGAGGGNGTAGAIMFLNCPSATLNPDPQSTLAGNWPSTLGQASDSPPFNGADADYQVLSAQVFRMEFCYLLKAVRLKDGTTQAAAYSGVPVAAPGDGRLNKLDATAAPTASDDKARGYAVGSRWYNTTDCRAYVCANNLPGAAVWNPLGMQDVAGIVVAIAALDPTSAAILPTRAATINGASTVVPDFSMLAAAFADLPLAKVGAGDSKTPDLTLSPPRLMAEAWNNTLAGSGFAASAAIPQAAAAQVHVYQRYFPLNGN